MKTKHQKFLHRLFNASILLKGMDGILEIIGGLILFFVSSDNLVRVLQFLFQTELVRDPKDVIANNLILLFQNLSLSAQLFASIYLFAHGIIKIWIVKGLLNKKLWAYSASEIVLGIFVIYQFYRYTHTHSLFLLILTLFDILIIFLVWLEWRKVGKKKLF